MTARLEKYFLCEKIFSGRRRRAHSRLYLSICVRMRETTACRNRKLIFDEAASNVDDELRSVHIAYLSQRIRPHFICTDYAVIGCSNGELSRFTTAHDPVRRG